MAGSRHSVSGSGQHNHQWLFVQYAFAESTAHNVSGQDEESSSPGLCPRN